jgi:hypothetical protein
MSSTVFAQQPPPMVVPASVPNVLHVGTAVQLETRDELTTERKALKVGQKIEMDVLQPVMLNGQVAIASGSHALAEITSVRNKGMWGKSGGITARVLYLEANGRQIKLNGSFNDRGNTGTLGVVASAALIPIAGFFVTGTSAKIAPGTHVTAFISEEVPVVFAGVNATAPLVVPLSGPSLPAASMAPSHPAVLPIERKVPGN